MEVTFIKKEIFVIGVALTMLASLFGCGPAQNAVNNTGNAVGNTTNAIGNTVNNTTNAIQNTANASQ
jgi:hypothetical protein